MFAEWVVIAVNDFNAEDLNAKDFDFLKSILTNLPSTTVVIFYATSVNLFTAKKSLTAKNKKLSDLISKGGISCEFNYKSASELSKYIISKAQKFDCTFTKKSAEYLANRCLCNTMMVDNEVKKLCDYKISGEISELDIDLLVAKAIDTNAFLLAKSLIKGDGKLTFQILDELFDSQAEPIVILSALSMAFIDLYRAKVAVNEGISQSYVVSDFSYRGREFAVKNAFFDCKNMPVERLRRCIKILSDCDIALKSLRTNNRLLLETTIVKMMIR